MGNCMDFRIYQRDDDGYARIVFDGELPEELADDCVISARIFREEDNLLIAENIPGTVAGRKWTVTLTVPEGGLYRIEAMSHLGVMQCVHHIGVGDIYVTCGQSNMTGYGKDNAYDPPTLGVHMLANTGTWRIATHPIAAAVGSVYGFPEADTGTSPALSFARRLKEKLGVPIGIIPTAVGGTALAAWNPDEGGECCREMYKRLDAIGKFKGFLWYQGCSDVDGYKAPTYFDRFARMISLWREKYGHCPVLTVQLNRWTGDPDVDCSKWWGIVRDAQRRAMLELEDVITVPSLDLPLTDGIHNSSGANVIIGERLANAALHSVYHKVGQMAPAVIGAEVVDDTHVRVKLSAGHQVYAMDHLAEGMCVEDENGMIECGKAIAEKDCLVVDTVRPYTLPAAFHYAWGNRTLLFPARDYNGMPLLSCYGIEIKPAAEK
ncbi:MAG: sialate O-acetylesterase [Ruminococcaceae bacterium]|nr:sialate O-acetylesterase [Oscillospiraceae bacterium]